MSLIEWTEKHEVITMLYLIGGLVFPFFLTICICSTIEDVAKTAKSALATIYPPNSSKKEEQKGSEPVKQ